MPDADPLDDSLGLLGHVLTVSDVVAETADAATIRFAVPEPLRAEFTFRAGQFLTLAVPSEREGWAARCYSLATAPGDADLAVTVKRIAGGYASNWLLDQVRTGDRLRALAPSGLFHPRSRESDLLLCAAGSGITPAISLLRDAVGSVTGRATLFYVNHDEDSAIYAAELRRLAAEHPDRVEVVHWFTGERGRPTADDFAVWAKPLAEREVFVCEPDAFVVVVRAGAAAAGFDTHRIRVEEYRSLTGDPFAPIADFSAESLSDASQAEVTIDGVDHTVVWPTTHTLVDALAVAGIDAPYACREGKCGACTCRLAEGSVDLGRTDALEPEDIADGYVLGCQARPTSRTVTIAF